MQKAEDFFKEMVNKSGNDAVSYETVKSDEKYEAWVILSFNDLSRVEIPITGRRFIKVFVFNYEDYCQSVISEKDNLR